MVQGLEKMRRGVPVQSVRQEKGGNSSFLRLLFCSGPYETGDWPPDWGEQSAPVSPWIQMQSPPGSALIDTPRTCLLGAQGQLGCHMRVTVTRLLLDSTGLGGEPPCPGMGRRPWGLPDIGNMEVTSLATKHRLSWGQQALPRPSSLPGAQ